MKLQYLPRVTARQAQPLTREKFIELIDSQSVEVNTRLGRQCLDEGNTDGYRKAKNLLPLVMWCGYDAEGKGRRAADVLTPTQLFMIDIDHMTMNPREAWEAIKKEMEDAEATITPIIVHVTPSGKGLRIVCHATEAFQSLKEHMDWLVNLLGLNRYGDYDEACKDFSRLSFLVPRYDILYMDWSVFVDDYDINLPKPITKANDGYTTGNGEHETGADGNSGVDGSAQGNDKSGNVAVREDSEEYRQLREETYHGRKLTEIVDRYIEVFGKPEKGEIHNHYNQMVKYFRCICNNDPRIVHAILPRFGDHPNEAELTWSQCKSICKQNTIGRLPREFFLFLVHNGFYPQRLSEDEKKIKEYVSDEKEPAKPKPKMPTLPPVFREFCSIAPDDFILPTINALMPILGTLASNFRAEDYDGVKRSTTFFNVIYAPAGSGKSFAGRLVDQLMKYITMRDEISSMRELIFLSAKSGKKANEKDPEDPHVSVRIMPAINSQPEFLQKMRDNKGYHMFTFAEEVDSFNKGTRGGGSDKSDLFRIGWDNGKYGQSFKSAATFKGLVRIFYNFLLTGTPNQVKKLYANVEDGMVTRVSFCEIANQEYAERPKWKKLNGIQRQIIEKYIKRMDEATYTEPLDFSVDEAYAVSEKDFDKEVPWRYSFRPFTMVNMEWIYKTIDAWTNSQRKEAVKVGSVAHDTFRRRTAQKGFRLALLCTTLWAKCGAKEQKVIKDFVVWWMDRDLEESLKLFEEKLNQTYYDGVNAANSQQSLFASVPPEFSKADVIAQATKLRIKTKAKMIIHLWKKEGLVEKVSADLWKKKDS